jgi:hypothetical protein
MTRSLSLLLVVGAVAACASHPVPPSPAAAATTPPLTVVHLPPTGRPLAKPPFRYMDYYRTEVRNQSERPLKIVWFEGFSRVDGRWVPGNVLGRVLRGKTFSRWYTEGDPVENGVIPPGKTAVCDVNWHGSNSPAPLNGKWAFIAVDDTGNDYFVEGIVDPSVVVRVDHAVAGGGPPR